MDVPSHLQIGMPANRTISGTKTAKKKIAWNCGIGTAKGSSGTIRRAVLKRISYAKFNKNIVLSAKMLQFSARDISFYFVC